MRKIIIRSVTRLPTKMPEILSKGVLLLVGLGGNRIKDHTPRIRRRLARENARLKTRAQYSLRQNAIIAQ